MKGKNILKGGTCKMIKKIMTGIIITAVLSLAATGTIYAHHKEQSDPDTVTSWIRQSELLDATAELPDATDKNTNYNNVDIPAMENRYQYSNHNQYSNTYRENEKNNNCEPVENNYYWKHNYNHNNENCSSEDCFEHNYKYEYNYRYENSCGDSEG